MINGNENEIKNEKKKKKSHRYNINRHTIIHRIFETNSSFNAKWCTTRKT